MSYWPPTRTCPVDHHPLGLAMQFSTHLNASASSADLSTQHLNVRERGALCFIVGKETSEKSW